MATPLEKLAEVSPAVADGFKQLRAGVFDGPLGAEAVELVVVGSLATTGALGALRVHVKRLLDMDVSPAAVRQAIVAPLAAASTLTPTVAALDAVADLLEEPS